ncbi:MAG: HEAT repeat domain-containing protein [Sandaracinaceae bacterium]|nr:HEAT repeat domain-containing protein [Sandaracinaceae bacterium]
MSGRIDVRCSSGALALGALLLALAAPAGAVAQPWSSHLLGPLARSEVRHPEALVRIDAARRLGRFGEPHRAVAALAEALEAEEDPRVRPAILDALARRGDEGSVPRIAQRLGDLGREDRAAALRAIGAIGGESAIRVLVEWLPAPDVGEDAAAALIRIGAPAVPHVLRALRQPPAAERAARVLGAIGDARATPALVGALEASPASLRIAAIEALAALGDERAVPAVARSLSDSATPVVDAALVALARLGGPELAPALAEIADGGAPRPPPPPPPPRGGGRGRRRRRRAWRRSSPTRAPPPRCRAARCARSSPTRPRPSSPRCPPRRAIPPGGPRRPTRSGARPAAPAWRRSPPWPPREASSSSWRSGSAATRPRSRPPRWRAPARSSGTGARCAAPSRWRWPAIRARSRRS